jgi:hypothetical protein
MRWMERIYPGMLLNMKSAAQKAPRGPWTFPHVIKRAQQRSPRIEDVNCIILEIVRSLIQRL